MEAKILSTQKSAATVAEEKKKKKQVVILIGLLLFLALMVFKTFFAGEKKKIVEQLKNPVPMDQSMPESVPADFPAVQQGVAEEGVSGEPGGWGTDPFSRAPISPRAAEAVNLPAAALSLQGVVRSAEGEALAIINEKILKKGDKVADNTVKDITDSHVVLETAEGETVTLDYP